MAGTQCATRAARSRERWLNQQFQSLLTSASGSLNSVNSMIPIPCLSSTNRRRPSRTDQQPHKARGSLASLTLLIELESRLFDRKDLTMTEMASMRRRIVGTALRRYREELGYALDDAARVLDCDRSKISRIETGQRGIRRRELLELLSEYGADKQAQDVLAKIANTRGARGWWRPYIDCTARCMP